jgi:hypothetical protein
MALAAWEALKDSATFLRRSLGTKGERGTDWLLSDVPSFHGAVVKGLWSGSARALARRELDRALAIGYGITQSYVIPPKCGAEQSDHPRTNILTQLSLRMHLQTVWHL